MSNPPEGPRRILFHVPIVHTAEDLGSMAEETRNRLSKALGAEAVARRTATIVAFWSALEGRICALPLAWDRTRLYQDGLPVGGHELAIVKELAEKGNRNHALLLSLVGRGATLMGTEDPTLLLREYRRIQRLVQLTAVGAHDALELRNEGDALLRERDEFIANRIDSTLREGESGILFVGLLHRVDELLRGKVELHSFKDSLPPGAEPWRQARRSQS